MSVLMRAYSYFIILTSPTEPDHISPPHFCNIAKREIILIFFSVFCFASTSMLCALHRLLFCEIWRCGDRGRMKSISSFMSFAIRCVACVCVRVCVCRVLYSFFTRVLLLSAFSSFSFFFFFFFVRWVGKLIQMSSFPRLMVNSRNSTRDSRYLPFNLFVYFRT